MSKQPPSVTQVARAERMKQAAETGAQARADVAARDIAVRKNMERLKALRLAKEAEEAALPKPAIAAAKPKAASRQAKTSAKTSAKSSKTPARLADFIRSEKEGGRPT